LAAESDDKSLVDAYREFQNQLSEPDVGSIVAAHEFFLDQHEDIVPNRAKARLLGCLLQVDETLLNRIISTALNSDVASAALAREKTVQEYPRILQEVLNATSREVLSETYPAESGWPEDMRVTISLLFCLVESVNLTEYKCFSTGRRPPTILLEVGYAPWSPAASAERLACIDFDEDWAVVVNWVYSLGFLPTILGFVRKDDLAGNVVRLSFQLPGEPGYLTGMGFDEIEGGHNGDQLLFDCLEASQEAPHVALDFLLPLQPAERAKLEGEMDFMDSGADEILAELLDFMDVDELYERFGKPSSAAYFSSVRDQLVQEKELREKEAAKRLGPYAERIDAMAEKAAGRRPGGFHIIGWGRKRDRLKEFLSDFVEQHGHLPTGKHDIYENGNWIVDFDEVQRKPVTEKDLDFLRPLPAKLRPRIEKAIDDSSSDMTDVLETILGYLLPRELYDRFGMPDSADYYVNALEILRNEDELRTKEILARLGPQAPLLEAWARHIAGPTPTSNTRSGFPSGRLLDWQSKFARATEFLFDYVEKHGRLPTGPHRWGNETTGIYAADFDRVADLVQRQISVFKADERTDEPAIYANCSPIAPSEFELGRTVDTLTEAEEYSLSKWFEAHMGGLCVGQGGIWANKDGVVVIIWQRDGIAGPVGEYVIAEHAKVEFSGPEYPTVQKAFEKFFELLLPDQHVAKH
jgi:hypothetical protein